MLKRYFLQAVSMVKVLFSPERTDDSPESRSFERYRRGIWTTVIMMLFKVTTILMNLITIPLTLSYLKNELFGVWMILTGIIEFAGFYDFGLGVGLRNLLIKCHAAGDDKEARNLIFHGVLSLTALSVILIFAVIFILPLLPWERIISCQDAAVAAQIRPAMQAMFSAFAIGLPAMQILNISVAYQRGYVGYTFFLLGRIAAFVFIFICVFRRLPFWLLTGGYLAIPFFCLFFGWIFFFKRHRQLIPRSLKFDLRYVKSLFSVGYWIVIHEIAYSAINATPLLILGHTINAAAVIPYSITMKLLNTTTIFSSAYRTGIYGAVGEAWHSRDHQWIRDVLRKTVFLWLGSTCVPLALLILIGPWIILLWTHNAAAVPSLLLITLCALAIAFSIASSLASGFLLSMNFVRFVAVFSFIGAVLQFVTCYACGRWTGSVNWVTAASLFFGMLLPCCGYLTYIRQKYRSICC